MHQGCKGIDGAYILIVGDPIGIRIRIEEVLYLIKGMFGFNEDKET